MSKIKTDDNHDVKPKNINFKIMLHHLKKGQSHVVGHCSLNLADHITLPDDKNVPYEKLIELKFQKCIDKFARLHVYVHSMRVTEYDPNLNYDLDDNMSAYHSLNSGNGLQSEYNYPDSMCGSTNGDFFANRLSVRARSPNGIIPTCVTPRMTLKPNQNQNDGKKRMFSNERNSTARIVGIDMNNSVKVASTLGVKKAMMKMSQMKNPPQKYGNKSFNMGHDLERLNKEGSPQRSDGKFYYVANG
jgi:hypothetical protein